MDAKRILLAGMVLVLTGACAWGATGTSGFTAVPESEAAQIVGGDGYVCDYNHKITQGPRYVPCADNGNHTACLEPAAWFYEYARFGCVPAESGVCYENLYVHFEYGACGWYPESGGCIAVGEVFFIYIWACA